jgi:hypothetical protein
VPLNSIQLDHGKPKALEHHYYMSTAVLEVSIYFFLVTEAIVGLIAEDSYYLIRIFNCFCH